MGGSEHFRDDRPNYPAFRLTGKPGKPELSVLIASYNARRTIATCLDSLRAQKTTRDFETILVDSSTDGTADLVRQQYPEVQLISSPSRLFAGDARNLGLKAAGAEIIAFLDADCFVESDWVDAVLTAQEGGHLLVSGTIENGTRDRAVAWAYYFCEFSHWLPRRGSRQISEAAGCCLSFKRRAYEAYGPFLGGTYSSDTAFHWRARKEGHKVHQDPSIRVFHQALYSVRDYLRHVSLHRWCYARVRVKERRLGLAGRLGHALLAPLLPLLLLPAIGSRVAASRCFRREFLGCLPLLFAGLCARAWGEFLGFAAKGSRPRQGLE